MKRIIIMGATSGLGRALALRYIKAGWIVGAAGRNNEALKSLKALAPSQVYTATIDITSTDAPKRLYQLIKDCRGMDTYLHSSGIALMSDELSIENEVKTANTNVTGFTRMVSAAYRYFSKSRTPGRIVAISSVAGVRGLEALPAYSASKSYDTTYLEALRQRAHGEHLPLRIVDIKPGWTRTPLLDDNVHYMFEMDEDTVADLIFKASLKAKRSATIGLRWRVLTTLERCIPSALWERLHLPLWHSK